MLELLVFLWIGLRPSGLFKYVFLYKLGCDSCGMSGLAYRVIRNLEVKPSLWSFNPLICPVFPHQRVPALLLSKVSKPWCVFVCMSNDMETASRWCLKNENYLTCIFFWRRLEAVQVVCALSPILCRPKEKPWAATACHPNGRSSSGGSIFFPQEHGLLKNCARKDM